MPLTGLGQAGGHSLVSEEKWIPNRTINCIFQDSEGLLWVGTGSGLYRYDGYRAHHYSTSPNQTNALFTNRVTDLAEDGAGRLVVAMESGISVLTKASGKIKTASPEITNYGRLHTLPSGQVLVLAGSARLSSLASDTTSGPALHPVIRDLPAFQGQIGVINDFTTLKNQHLLIGSSKGLFEFDPASQQLLALGLDHPVSRIKLLRSGRILVGTAGQGLFEVRVANRESIVLRQFHFGNQKDAGYDEITSISEGPFGKVLVSTHQMYYLASDREPLLAFDAPSIPPTLLEDNNIVSTHIDRSGVLWIGTLRGLLKVRPTPIQSERIRIKTPGQPLLNQQVHYLYPETSTRYWLATKSDGVFVFNPIQKEFRRVELPTGVRRFSKSENGYYLAYGNDKVYRFNTFSLAPQTQTVLTTTQSISAGLEVSPGEWWFGCIRNGLLVYNDSGQSPYSNLVEEINRQFNRSSTIFALMRDSRQNIWIGSRGDGLLKVNLQTGKLKKYSGIDLQGEISRRILHIKEDSRGRIWIGTREGGLYLYHAEKDTFQQFTIEHGLPSNVICALGEDQSGRILVSTDHGLATYHENSPIPFRAFGQKDGIDYTDFSFHSVAEAENGDVYFGNSNGLYRVRLPDPPRTNPPGFRWTAFQIAQNSGSQHKFTGGNDILANFDSEKGIALDHDQNSFEVSFALLNYVDPAKNQYAYRLKGHDAQWKYLLREEPRVYFHDLPHGNYTLEVKAADSYGNWEEVVHTLRIRVAAPVWLSWPAYLLYLFVAAIAGYLLFRVIKRMNHLKKQLHEKGELIDLKEQQMIYFSDLSHELKNRLSLILGPLEKALAGKKVNQAVLNNLYEHTLRLKRISDQIMNLRKSEAGEFLLEVSQGPLFAAMERLCHQTEPLAVIRNIRLHYSFGSEPKEAWFDDELLEIILLNLLNNAIKYTPSGGQVQVSGQIVALENSDLPNSAPAAGRYLKCTVQDTGIGIPSEEIKSLFDRFYRASNAKQNDQREGVGIGLDLVARLIKKHRGFIDVTSQEGDGTRVEFHLPIEKNHYQLNETKLSGQSVPILESNSVPSRPAPGPAQGHKARLLLVDDDPDILACLDEHLSPYFSTLRAADGIEAWNLLLSEPVDLIISDLSMPGLNGLALLQRVKADSELRQVPFIILTGRNSEAQKLTCLQNGVDDFIDKPFSIDLILWRARNLIESRTLLRSQYARHLRVEPEIGAEKSANELFLEQVVKLIEENIRDSVLSVEFLADQCAMSRATFYRKMESLIDQPPSVFIRTYRLKKAAKLLQSGNYYVAEVAYQTGFNNPKYFSKCFQKEFGCSPTEYIKTLTNVNPN